MSIVVHGRIQMAFEAKARFRELLWDPALFWVDDACHEYSMLFRQLQTLLSDRLTWYRWLGMLTAMVATVAWTRPDLDSVTWVQRVTSLFERWPLPDTAEHTLHLLRRARPRQAPLERYARLELWYLRHRQWRFPMLVGEDMENSLEIVTRQLQQWYRSRKWARRLRHVHGRPLRWWHVCREIEWGLRSVNVQSMAENFRVHSKVESHIVRPLVAF